jgi:iron complex outermembrane receptor protein
MKRSILSSIELALTLGLAASAAIAQDSVPVAEAPAASGAKAASEGLQQVVVTAERRSANVQSIPLAVNTVSGDQLSKAGTVTLDAALREVPSVQMRESNKGAYVTVRGIGGALDPTTGNPGVSLNIDGVYHLQSATVTNGLYDVNRVEVLKGPQGTLYGRNATGGSVNIITNDPSNKREGKLTLQLGNYDQVRAEAMFNTPLSETVAVRGAILSNRHSGYLDDGYNNADTQAARLKVLLKPSADLRVLLSSDYQKWLGVHGDVLPRTGNAVASNNRPWVDGFPYNTATAPATNDGNPLSGRADNHASDLHAQIDWKLGFANLTYIPAHTDFLIDQAGRGTGDYSTTKATEKQITHELRLASPASSAIEWVAGGYYLSSDQTADVAFPGVNPNRAVTAVSATSQAVFGQATYPITDAFSLIGGLRHTSDERSQDKEVFQPRFTGGSTGLVTSEQNSSATNYKVGVQLKLGAASLLYATHSTGYKGGGFTAVDSFLPEHVKAYEIGSKNRFLNNRLQVNGALFYTGYTDYQATSIGTFTYPTGQTFNTSRAFNASGLTVIKGGELEAVYKLSPSDRIDMSATYVSARFGTFVLPTGQNYTGFALPNVPRLGAAMAYEHVWDLASGASVTASFRSRAQAPIWTNFTHLNGSYQPGYAMTDLSLLYASPDNSWSLSGYVKNAGNVAVQDGALSGSLVTVTVGAPRTFGLVASKSF